jgi:hypothetical protein
VTFEHRARFFQQIDRVHSNPLGTSKQLIRSNGTAFLEAIAPTGALPFTYEKMHVLPSSTKWNILHSKKAKLQENEVFQPVQKPIGFLNWLSPS